MIGGIAEIISKGELPSDSAPLLEHLTEPSGQFIAQEGAFWDFKREWPFSYSDSYFCGIARLICAFANSHGGLIIFGVHDEHRTGGHNRVSPNMDRLQQALKQLLSERPALQLGRYNEDTSSTIDVLLVSPKAPAAMPIRFSRDSAPYKANVIWVRQGHEVVAAEPRHLTMLYCRDDAAQAQDGEADSYLSGGLPPSPATIKKFVGRMQAFVYASQQPPQLDDARNHFARAFVMKYEPDIEHLKPWYFAEKNSGHGLEQCIKITDLICQGKKYDDETKQIFLSRKASLLFNRGRENIYFDHSRGLNDLEAAMTLHLSSYEKAYDSGNSRLDKIEEYTRNSAYVLFQFLASNQRFDDLVETILRICESTSAKIDPLEEPIARAADSFLHVHGSKSDLQRLAGRLEYLGKRLANLSRWYDRFACGRLQDHIKMTIANLNISIKKIAERKPY